MLIWACWSSLHQNLSAHSLPPSDGLHQIQPNPLPSLAVLCFHALHLLKPHKMKIKCSFIIFSKGAFFFFPYALKGELLFGAALVDGAEFFWTDAHCLQGEDWLCLFGDHCDPDHKGFPLSIPWMLFPPRESQHGDPETWGNPRGGAVNNHLFCDFHFSLCLTFLKLSFLRNTSFRKTDCRYISRQCRTVTRQNKNSRKRARLRWEMVYVHGLLSSVSQMKCPCIFLRTLKNKQIIKSYPPFVCVQMSVMLAVSLVFDVSNCRIHLYTVERFQSTSHFQY